MKREQDFARRLQTLEALHDAVSAMRSLSAHHFRVVRGRFPQRGSTARRSTALSTRSASTKPLIRKRRQACWQ